MNDRPVISAADERASDARDSTPVMRHSPAPVPRLLSPYLHLVLTVTLVTVAELLLKQGAMETVSRGTDWLGLAALPSPRVWAGAALLTLSAGTWIVVLRAMPLYLAFTLSSVVHVTIPICSWLVLGEKINIIRWAGISLVLLGIWIIARPVSRVEERQ
jgi:drug/metabolite transporter (DMT)-like permease